MAPTVAQRGYLAFLDATVEPFRPLGVMRNSGVDLAAILRIVALFEAAYWAFRLGVRGYQRRRGGTKGKADEDMLWFGGSYVVTLVMSAFVAVRGTALFMLLLTLAAPKGVTTFGVLSEVQDPEEADFFARAMAHATYTNEVFLAYLVYDIMHMAYQFKGYYRTDMALHHAGFLFCSTFCQSYSAMVFAFSWLIQGEYSTVFLELRWLLRKAGVTGNAAFAVDMGFLGSFFFSRVVLYGYGLAKLVYECYFDGVPNPEPEYPMALHHVVVSVVTACWFLNLSWFQGIIKVVKRSFFSKDKSAKAA